MRVHRLIPVFAVLLPGVPLPAMAATPPALQAEQSPTMPAPAGNFMGRTGKLGGLLTPEQRAMLTLQMQAQMKDMPQAQKRTFRKEQLAKLLSLSQSDRQKFQADLQARWDALPPRQKDRIQQRLARSGQSAQ